MQCKNCILKRFSVKKLNEVEGKGKCQVKLSNRFAVLENLDDVDISIVWVTV
jgi:hypothetical protein